MSEPEYRRAPSGFTPEQWEAFMEEGLLVLEDALSPDEVAYYTDAIDRLCASDPRFDASRFYGPDNAVERAPEFAELIDHLRHVGFVYDVYGELLKLHISQVFVRPRRSSYNAWHPDGARMVPYGVFCPFMPIQIKVSYWLTDTLELRMGNFVYLPGSHRSQTMPAYTTHESVPGEKVLCCRAGTITLMHCNVWHRVEPNDSDAVRKNIFLAYCPSWVCEADRLKSSDEWLGTLNREQRIIMRAYGHAYARTKPPAEDAPLFLDRETGANSDADVDPRVPLHSRKRRTTIEKWIEKGIVPDPHSG
ncbi:phytanoyl-CoA dioxygenase family protein [Candidatus Poribacteria bacterium]|nr:phytanoyl-CoA dioxygenase family protein [Candidatus Poribacteria bacterium]